MASAVWWCWHLHWSVGVGKESHSDHGQRSDADHTLQVSWEGGLVPEVHTAVVLPHKSLFS